MNRKNVAWMLCLLVAASAVASCSAAAAAAIDEKPSKKNIAAVTAEIIKDASRESKALKAQEVEKVAVAGAAAEIKETDRESKALKSDTAYNSYPQPNQANQPEPSYHVAQPHPQAQPLPFPVPSTAYTNPQETTMGYVYYYLPQVEKYYPKVRDLLPYIKRYQPVVSRAWPMLRGAADRTFSLTSAVGLTLLVPALLVSVVGFLGFLIFLFLFPAVSVFGRRRMGRDVGDENAYAENFDFDDLLPLEQSRKLASLSARVDNMLENYVRDLKSDTCLEKFSCQAGQLTNRLGKVTHPLIALLEPYIPSYMSNKFSAFKIGARSGSADCSQFKCKLPFFGN